MSDPTEKLLPCPWCGHNIETITVIEGSTFRWRQVSGCCTDGPEVRHATMDHDQQHAEADSRARAILAWNTRSAQTTPDPRLDEMASWVHRLAQALDQPTPEPNLKTQALDYLPQHQLDPPQSPE